MRGTSYRRRTRRRSVAPVSTRPTDNRRRSCNRRMRLTSCHKSCPPDTGSRRRMPRDTRHPSTNTCSWPLDNLSFRRPSRSRRAGSPRRCPRGSAPPQQDNRHRACIPRIRAVRRKAGTDRSRCVRSHRRALPSRLPSTLRPLRPRRARRSPDRPRRLRRRLRHLVHEHQRRRRPDNPREARGEAR